MIIASWLTITPTFILPLGKATRQLATDIFDFVARFDIWVVTLAV